MTTTKRLIQKVRNPKLFKINILQPPNTRMYVSGYSILQFKIFA